MYFLRGRWVMDWWSWVFFGGEGGTYSKPTSVDGKTLVGQMRNSKFQHIPPRISDHYITFLSRQTCWKNSIEWIRNWCFLYSLEDVIISGEILESHIGNDKEYEFGLDIGLGFRHVWTRPTYSINNNIFYFIFELVNLYTTVIFETVFQF